MNLWRSCAVVEKMVENAGYPGKSPSYWCGVPVSL
nr:MAG TPA: hypothetical protein [Caudoviricetes sp.]